MRLEDFKIKFDRYEWTVDCVIFNRHHFGTVSSSNYPATRRYYQGYKYQYITDQPG